MSEAPIRLAVIIGSVRAERFAPVVANWLRGELRSYPGLNTDVIDLADLTLPVNLDGSGDAPELLDRIAAADAFVVITPEYNHGYPGYLKIAIDTARDEWKTKPVGFVCYGGMAGGLRSVEQLRPVFAELQVVTIRETVSFAWVHDQFDTTGNLRDPARAIAGAQSLLDQLVWWARTLRSARAGA